MLLTFLMRFMTRFIVTYEVKPPCECAHCSRNTTNHNPR